MYRSDIFSKLPGIVHGFSSAEDGNLSYRWGARNDALKNRARFFGGMGIDPERCVQMFAGTEPQARISFVHSSVAGRGMFADDSVETDALVTNEKGLGLVLLVADCLPVLLVDPEKKVIALLHLGWRSTVAGLAKATVDFLSKEFHSDPKDLRAFFGPGIHVDSYRFTHLDQKGELLWRSHLREFPDGTVGIDLYGFNQDAFLSCGIPADQIEMSDEDTVSSVKWFSHYRAKKTGEAEGRFGAVLMLK